MEAQLTPCGRTVAEQLRRIVQLETERDELREVCDGMERGVIDLAAENVKLGAENAALRAQLATAQAETWQPVADGRYGRIIVRDGTLQVPHGGVDPLAAPIPDGYALCRRVSQQEAPNG